MRTRGMTQQILAKNLGITQQCISMKLSGKTAWEVRDLLKISALFGISLDDLLIENKEVAPEQVAA